MTQQNAPLRTQAPTVATTREPQAARERSSSLSEIAIAIARGKHFTAATARAAVPVGNDYSSVLKAPADKILILEDVFFNLDFDTAANGTFNIVLDGYLDTSLGNSWAYTPVAPVPLGRPLNGAKVNDVAASTIDLGITPDAPGITGNPDYNFFNASYVIDSVGNRNTVSANTSTFFGADRKLILGPRQELLARTVTSGNATGTGTVRTLIFTSEVALADVPRIMGATLEEMGITV